MWLLWRFITAFYVSLIILLSRECVKSMKKEGSSAFAVNTYWDFYVRMAKIYCRRYDIKCLKDYPVQPSSIPFFQLEYLIRPHRGWGTIHHRKNDYMPSSFHNESSWKCHFVSMLIKIDRISLEAYYVAFYSSDACREISMSQNAPFRTCSNEIDIIKKWKAREKFLI